MAFFARVIHDSRSGTEVSLAKIAKIAKKLWKRLAQLPLSTSFDRNQNLASLAFFARANHGSRSGAEVSLAKIAKVAKKLWKRLAQLTLSASFDCNQNLAFFARAIHDSMFGAEAPYKTPSWPERLRRNSIGFEMTGLAFGDAGVMGRGG